MSNQIRAFVFCLVAFLPIRWGLACPLVERLPDFNCDATQSIVVVGDSLVAGIGDTKNGNSGGYVLRTQARFPGATVTSHGVPGLRTLTLIKTLRRVFANPTDSPLAQKLLAADLVVLDLGRNDRWGFGLPSATLRNLKRVRTMIEAGVKQHGHTPPLVVTAVMMYPNRGSQGPWVKELDNLILESSTTEAPADLRFDLVSKRLLSPDNIHPSSKGYAALTEVFVDWLLNEYRQYAQALRPDQDNDGLYDVFERSKFGTDPSNADTDSDGINDGSDPAPVG